MPADALDDTVASFPTYAALTETQGWGTAMPVPVSPFEETTRVEDPALRRYTEGALLGVGGMGKVMLAHDARIGREVAVKQLHGDRELAPDERARFLREARVQGQLEHPSIVPVYDIDRRADGATFFTMRRVLGRTLHAIIEDLRAELAGARDRYTQRELLTAFATICLTIDYAHSRGVIHRDLKPANIMLGDFGEVYVLDWGLARLVGDSERAPVQDAAPPISVRGEMMGTPLYMAPEQMADPEVGPGADVFALGAILFEILTLERLREPRTLHLPAEARTSVRAPGRGIAPELETICVRATQSAIEERYPSARALHAAVVRYLEGDRELEQRRVLAAGHARAAREALARADAPDADYERERGNAMRELVRALALEPTNADHVATLGEIMASPPKLIPARVAAQLAAGEQQLVRTGARHSVIAALSWFAFLPVVIYMGVRGPGQTALILSAAGLSAILSAVAWRMRYIPTWIQLAVITLTLFGAAATSRMFGPLILVPTLVATFTIVIQAHPSRRMRLITMALGVIALTAPVLLELAGVLPSSYAFTDNRMVVLPQLHHLPETPTILLLLGAGLAMMIIPGLFITRLREALSDAQRTMLLQAWHFRRLAAELIEAKSLKGTSP